MPNLVRPELGPTLPTLIERRFGVRPRTTLLVLAALVLGLGLLVLATLRLTSDEEILVHREPAPAFTLKYDGSAVDVVDPRPGELERLEQRRGRASSTVTVTPLALPAYRGDASHALLPSVAERRKAELAREFDGFELLDEGKARVNGAPGYQLGYRYGQRGRRTYGRDVLLLPDEEGSEDALVVRYAIRREGGKVRPADRRRLKQARSAFRSFRYGTERP